MPAGGASAGGMPAGTEEARAGWRLRSQGTLGTHLEALREKAFALAEVGRQHLVLDANSGTGLLTWEAVRLAAEGGVWALAGSEREAAALSDQARAMPALNAPVVLHGALEDLPQLIAAREPGGVRFDRILARNVLGRAVDKGGRIATLAGLLAPGGRLVVVEPVPRLGERLLAAQDWSGLPEALTKRVLAAEEAVYADQADPMVNWDDNDLAGWCEAAGLRVRAREVAGSIVEFPLGAGLLTRWFGAESAHPEKGGGGSPGAGKLGALLGEDAETVRRHLEQALDGGALRRKVAVAFLVGERER